MILQKNSPRAWKLPLFAVAYILVSYLAEAMARSLQYSYSPEWLAEAWNVYCHMWFGPYKLLTVPLWALFYMGLLFTGVRYYRSGLTRWGWGVALLALLCSATGGYSMDIVFLILERLFQAAM